MRTFCPTAIHSLLCVFTGCPYVKVNLSSNCDTPITNANFSQDFQKVDNITYVVSVCDGATELTITHDGFEDTTVPIAEDLTATMNVAMNCTGNCINQNTLQIQHSKQLFICLAFGICRFCVVIRFCHPRHNGQWPPTSKDFYSRLFPLHCLTILILEKEPVFPFFNVQCLAKGTTVTIL